MHVAEVTGAIRTGELDGDLLAVNQAVIERVAAIGMDTRWVITIDGQTIDQDEMTVREVRTAEQIAKATWVKLNPIATAAHWAAVVAACLHHRTGVPLDEAIKQADAYPMSAVSAGTTEREVPSPPKD